MQIYEYYSVIKVVEMSNKLILKKSIARYLVQPERQELIDTLPISSC